MTRISTSRRTEALYLVIFDCDGTLIDSQNVIYAGLEHALRQEGIPVPDRKTALSIVGLSLEVAIAELVGEAYRSRVPRMADAYREFQLRLRAEGVVDPLYPGAREALDALSAREDVLLGVATGKALRGVVHMEESHGLVGRFVTRQTADRAPSKPHPAMIFQAMEETGVEPSRTVMIGDTGFDMEMAKNAGVASIGVTWGYHDEARLRAAGAGQVIGHFDALEGTISRLFGWNREAA